MLLSEVNLKDSTRPNRPKIISQEAMRNVARRAGKTLVKVVLAGQGDRSLLKVMDFGPGFGQESKPAASGLGLISMQERPRFAGGLVSIASKLGEGTTVTVDVPHKPNA